MRYWLKEELIPTVGGIAFSGLVLSGTVAVLMMIWVSMEAAVLPAKVLATCGVVLGVTMLIDGLTD